MASKEEAEDVAATEEGRDDGASGVNEEEESGDGSNKSGDSQNGDKEEEGEDAEEDKESHGGAAGSTENGGGDGTSAVETLTDTAGKTETETIEDAQKKLGLGELKALVERTLEQNPAEKMKKMNIESVPEKKKKQVRALEKHLWRIKLDQRHALHDPRFKNAKGIRLGQGSVQIFNNLLQGYAGGEHTEDLTEGELRAMERANRKKPFVYGKYHRLKEHPQTIT